MSTKTLLSFYTDITCTALDLQLSLSPRYASTVETIDVIFEGIFNVIIVYKTGF
jgi:hypothetical protein